MSERLLNASRKFSDLQAEYEGSIPFTRSTIFFATTLRFGALFEPPLLSADLLETRGRSRPLGLFKELSL